MARITVEDCLEKVDNRFALVQLVSKRAKQLLTGSKLLIDGRKGNKSVVNALREVADGVVRFKTEQELAKEKADEERRRAEELEAREAAAAPPLPANGNGPHQPDRFAAENN